MNFARYARMSNRQRMRTGLAGFALSNCGLDVVDNRTGAKLGMVQLRRGFGDVDQEVGPDAVQEPARLIPFNHQFDPAATFSQPLAPQQTVQVVSPPSSPAPGVTQEPIPTVFFTPPATTVPAATSPEPITVREPEPLSIIAQTGPTEVHRSDEPSEAEKLKEIFDRALEEERKANLEAGKRFEVSLEEARDIFNRALKAGLKPEEAAGVVKNVIEQRATQKKPRGPIKKAGPPENIIDLDKSPEEREAQLQQFLAAQKVAAAMETGVGGPGFFSTPIATLPIIGPVTPVGATVGGFGVWAIFKLLKGRFLR